MRRIYFDTEFLENGRTIDLLSIGLVDDRGRTFYAIDAECDIDQANDWVRAHVLPLLHTPDGPSLPRAALRQAVLDFCGAQGPLEFWAYNGAFDWVVLCQLFGSMRTFPDQWPTYCMDIKQWRDHLRGTGPRPALPKQTTPVHHALNDALWVKEAWHALEAWSSGPKAQVERRIDNDK